MLATKAFKSGQQLINATIVYQLNEYVWRAFPTIFGLFSELINKSPDLGPLYFCKFFDTTFGNLLLIYWLKQISTFSLWTFIVKIFFFYYLNFFQDISFKNLLLTTFIVTTPDFGPSSIYDVKSFIFINSTEV